MSWQRRTLGAGLIVAGVLLIQGLIALWPAVDVPVGEERSIPLLFGLAKIHLDADAALLQLVVIAGGLGAAVNTGTEFASRGRTTGSTRAIYGGTRCAS